MWTRRAVVVALAALSLAAGLAGAAAEGYAAAAPADRAHLALALGGTLVGLGWSWTGGLLVWLRPTNAVGWGLLLVGSLTQVTLTEEAAARAGWLGSAAAAGDWTARWPGLVLSLVGGWAIMTMLGALPAIYPEGRLRAGDPRWPVVLVGLGAAGVQVQWVTMQPSLGGTATQVADPTLTGGVVGLVPLGVYLLGAATIWVLAVVALRRSTSPRRQQLALLLGSVVLLLVLNLLREGPLTLVLQVASLYLLPVAVALALLRYRLLGVDAGPRVDPLRTVVEIGSRASRGDDQDADLLVSVLSSVRLSVTAPAARLLDPSGRVVATSGELTRAGFTADLGVAGEEVGVLEVEPRWSDGGFTAREERVLQALATQLAALLRAQTLAVQLQAQRDLALTARMQERARLRRELHDGIGPALTGMGLGLAGLEDAITAGDAARAGDIAGVLRAETAGTVREVRRVLDDLRPEALESGSLAEAIRQRAAATAPSVAVDVQVGPLPRLAARVEVAAYRVVSEAVANAVQHSGASLVTVRAHVDESDELVLEVADDGRGFDPAAARGTGIGLSSMRDRADELGGVLAVESTGDGTTVSLRLPTAVAVG